jgi:hypothetical protein
MSKAPAIRDDRHIGCEAAGYLTEIILEGYPWLEPDDVKVCLAYARRVVGHERVEPLLAGSGS